MKKRNFVYVALLSIGLVLCGCSTQNDLIMEEPPESTSQETEESVQGAEEEVISEEESKVVEEPEIKKVKFSELIPDPEEYFFNTEFERLTDDSGYTVYLDYVTKEEWDNYISKCEEDGYWSDESYRSEYSWYVDSEDGLYELLLDRYGDKNEYMTIIVNRKED